MGKKCLPNTLRYLLNPCEIGLVMHRRAGIIFIIAGDSSANDMPPIQSIQKHKRESLVGVLHLHTCKRLNAHCSSSLVASLSQRSTNRSCAKSKKLAAVLVVRFLGKGQVKQKITTCYRESPSAFFLYWEATTRAHRGPSDFISVSHPQLAFPPVHAVGGLAQKLASMQLIHNH